MCVTLLHDVNSGGVTFSQVFPSSCVRSGLNTYHELPPSAVRNKTCEPKYSTCGSIGEKTSGSVQVLRYLPGCASVGGSSCTSSSLKSCRATVPPNTTLGFSGSGAM